MGTIVQTEALQDLGRWLNDYRTANCRLGTACAVIRYSLDHPEDEDARNEAARAADVQLHEYDVGLFSDVINLIKINTPEIHQFDRVERFLGLPQPEVGSPMKEVWEWLEEYHAVVRSMICQVEKVRRKILGELQAEDSPRLSVAPEPTTTKGFNGEIEGSPKLVSHLALTLNDVTRFVRSTTTGVEKDLYTKPLYYGLLKTLASRRLGGIKVEELKEVWDDCSKRGRRPKVGTVVSTISELRKILSPFGLGIKCGYQIGYRLEKISREA